MNVCNHYLPHSRCRRAQFCELGLHERGRAGRRGQGQILDIPGQLLVVPDDHHHGGPGGQPPGVLQVAELLLVLTLRWFQTTAGKLAGGLCALAGVFLLTLPLPIVVNSFAALYKNRLWRTEVTRNRSRTC